MRKNSVHSEVLAHIVLNKRSRLNDDFYEICGEDDEIAKRLRNELKGVLSEMLKGNFEPVTTKLAQYAEKPAPIKLQPYEPGKVRATGFSARKIIRIGQRYASYETQGIKGAEPEEVIYGVLRRSIENNDLQRLSLCQTCERLFYRKSLKGRFCNDDCRWAHFNTPEQRHSRYSKLLMKRRGLKPKRRRRKTA